MIVGWGHCWSWSRFNTRDSIYILVKHWNLNQFYNWRKVCDNSLCNGDKNTSDLMSAATIPRWYAKILVLWDMKYRWTHFWSQFTFYRSIYSVKVKLRSNVKSFWISWPRGQNFLLLLLLFENGTCSHSLGRNRTPIEKKKKWMNFQRKKSYRFNK